MIMLAMFIDGINLNFVLLNSFDDYFLWIKLIFRFNIKFNRLLGQFNILISFKGEPVMEYIC